MAKCLYDDGAVKLESLQFFLYKTAKMWFFVTIKALWTKSWGFVYLPTLMFSKIKAKWFTPTDFVFD